MKSLPLKLTGKIIRGEQRGRQLGFPTANLDVSKLDLKDLEAGIYASRVWVNGVKYLGATSVGFNLTFGQKNFTVETYILDFKQDIYGQTVELHLVKKLREMLKFESMELLIQQIQKDVEMVRKILKQ